MDIIVWKEVGAGAWRLLPVGNYHYLIERSELKLPLPHKNGLNPFTLALGKQITPPDRRYCDENITVVDRLFTRECTQIISGQDKP